jgi:hypothetical protein
VLKGYKTYVVAAVGIIAAVAGYLTGDLTIAQAGQAVLTAALGATIRHGIG